MRDRPESVLTRHFFTSLFDFGFLSDDGAESLKRAMLGSLAVALAIGLLLTRVFMAKYSALSKGSFDDYARAVVADHAFLMAIPMWVVAGAVGLVGHSLFPDRTDFRILMAEPLSRLTIFSSKLAALLLFVGLFVAAAHLALLPLAALTLVGAMKTGSILTTALAFGLSSLSGSLFAALAVVAIHGLLVLFAPRGTAARGLGRGEERPHRRTRALLAAHWAVTCDGRRIRVGCVVAPVVPPAWFVGLERWLIGESRYAALATEAAIAAVLVLVVSVASYVLLYRRFDRVMLQPAASRSESGWRRSLNRWVGRAPVGHAIRRFVSLTIRRSVLHQGLIVGLLAAAGGFVLNSLLSANGWNKPLDLRLRSPFLLTMLWAPVTMMFLAIPAIRVALSVPLDTRANWVFRMTEDVAGRAEVAAAVVRTVLALGVVLPLALLGPVQWWVLGSSAAGIIALEAVMGWLVVEWVMSEWGRIPFTCSYIPGKGFVPHMFVKGFASYIVFTTGATIVLRISLGHPPVGLVIGLIAGAAAGALSLRRTRHAPLSPLLFDDELPSDVNPLRLNAD